MTIETEWNLLGAMLLDNSIVEAYPLTPADFADQRNRSLYETIRKLTAKGEPADIVTVASASGVNVGALAEYANNSTAGSNIAAYHAMLKRHGSLRKARAVAERLSEAASMDDIESCLSDLIALSHTQESHESDQVTAVRRAVDHLELIESGVKPGLTTGIATLDRKLGGLQPGDLIVIAARSQHGKTALMMNMANAQTDPVGIISGEQPNVQIAMRSMAMTASVSLQRMRTGTLQDADWQRLNTAIQSLHDKRVQIFDKGGPSITEIMAVARQWKQRHGIKILFVDFLQLVTGGDGNEHRLQIGDVARKLKTLAKQLNIPIVALAQIRRAVDGNPAGPTFMGRLPFAADLADSAQIEDAADQIITLYRPSVYWPNEEHLEGKAFLNITKNRHGATGTIAIEWVGEYLQFGDRAA